MYLALDELLKILKDLRKILIKIQEQLLDEENFDRLLVLVCMGKGGFLPLEALPNRAVMNMICESSELFEKLFPYVDQQFLYQCMDNGTKAEIMQCIHAVKQRNISKSLQEEYYFKALTIFYQIIYETISCNEKLWEEFTYRLVSHWNSFNKEFIAHKQIDN